mmetsp:Transcript_106/g.155  ORF Transcript_106/g.155 Transcript_106/m.155 type:complete len:90 (-) Transcript_106:55-324(-)|eukprot:scaffold193_cov139-Amphora_coffeaeformis.AAC.2
MVHYLSVSLHCGDAQGLDQDVFTSLRLKELGNLCSYEYYNQRCSLTNDWIVFDDRFASKRSTPSYDQIPRQDGGGARDNLSTAFSLSPA